MTTQAKELLRKNLTFRALQRVEIGIAAAIAPFTAQLASFDQNQGDYKEDALIKNRKTAIGRATEAADAYIKDEFEAKLVPAFKKAFGRSQPAYIPVKDTGLVSIQLAQLAGMNPAGGAELLLPIVKRLESDPDDQQAAAHLGVLLPVLENKLLQQPIDDAQLPANEVNPVVDVIQRAKAARTDDQAHQGQAGEALLNSLRTQVNDVRDAVARTGGVLDDAQAVIAGELVERARRPDLFSAGDGDPAEPATDVMPPAPQEGKDVVLTPKQAANDTIWADAQELATKQGGTALIGTSQT